MARKLWIRIFAALGVILAAFALLLLVANGTFLNRYYVWQERQQMVNMAKDLNKMNFVDEETLTALSKIELQRNYVITVFDEAGNLVFPNARTTIIGRGGVVSSVVDISRLRSRLIDVGEPQRINEHMVFATGTDVRSGGEVYIIGTTLDNDFYAEITTPVTSIEQSAKIANQFILFALCIGLLLALLWAVWYARRFARPISDMNEITKGMAALDFHRRLIPRSRDEIGQLGHSINALSDTLDTTLKDLSDKNERLKGEIERERALDAMRKGFVANVSHELKTPISIIQGYAEGLKLGLTDNTDEYCDVIIEESNRMNRLVLDLIELSKYESGGMTLEKTEFRLRTLIDGVLTKLEPRFSAAGITPENWVPDTFCITADPLRIEQVLTNYLNNALSHVGAGKTIRVTGQQQERMVQIYVYNSDSHVADEDIEQIWQSFYRGDKSHSRQEGRYGLGLSIVQAIMALHGGQCGVQNTEDGVIFEFGLPM